jgi:hypothetical protein
MHWVPGFRRKQSSECVAKNVSYSASERNHEHDQRRSIISDDIMHEVRTTRQDQDSLQALKRNSRQPIIIYSTSPDKFPPRPSTRQRATGYITSSRGARFQFTSKRSPVWLQLRSASSTSPEFGLLTFRSSKIKQAPLLKATDHPPPR